MDTLIRSEAAQAEADRRLTEPVVRELVGSGATRLLAPKRHGGAELDLPSWSRTVQELARADGSTGWCAMTASCTSLIGWFLPDADEVFGDPTAVVAGTAAPIGSAVGADGGYLVTGRWGWGSAVPHCTWIVGGTMTPDGPRLAVMPSTDVTIHDTWYAAGLRATGSHDFSVDELFVPSRRAVWPASGKALVEGPIPAFPFYGVLGTGVASVTLGIAARAIEEIEALAVAKTPQHTTVRLAEQVGAQLDIATASARLAGARAFLHEAVTACWELAVAGTEVPLESRTRLRLACSHAAAEAAEVTQQAFRVGGGSSVFETSVLQRCLRDVHTAGQHTIVSRRLFETYARVRLGIEVDTRRL